MRLEIVQRKHPSGEIDYALRRKMLFQKAEYLDLDVETPKYWWDETDNLYCKCWTKNLEKLIKVSQKLLYKPPKVIEPKPVISVYKVLNE